MHLSLHRFSSFLVVAAASVASCSSSPETPESPKELAVYTWWKEGPEKVARDALFDEVRKRYPGIAITDVDPSMRDIRKAQVADGTRLPPMDAFPTIGGSDFSPWVDRWNPRPLDAISATRGWATAFPKPLLEAFSWRGTLEGLPLYVERDNTLFYNKHVLADAGVAPPRSIDEFFTVAEALKARGITPLSVSASGGWTIATQVFGAMLVAEAGPEFVRSYLAGSQTADAPEMESTLTDLGRMMDYANADRVTTGWGLAVEKVCAGAAAMIYLPDFVLQHFATVGCGPDEIGYVAVEPAQTPTFVFAAVGFVSPGDAPHPDAADGFAEVVGSIDGQRAFSLPKGSIPARFDVPLDGFDPFAQRTMADYAASQHHVPGYAIAASAAFQERFNPALQAFVDPSRPEFKDVPQLLSILRSSYSMIVP